MGIKYKLMYTHTCRNSNQLFIFCNHTFSDIVLYINNLIYSENILYIYVSLVITCSQHGVFRDG